MLDTTTVNVRWMIAKDLESTVSIDGATSDSPWSEEEFRTCLRQRNCIGMVAEQDEDILGYIVYELHKNRLVVVRMGFLPESMLNGVGEAMIEKLIGKLSHDKRRVLQVNINERDLATQLFLRDMGFIATPCGDEIQFEYFCD